MSKSVTISNQGELANFTESNKEGDVQLRVEFPMSQDDLRLLAESDVGARMTQLSICPEYDDREPPIIDFSLVSFPTLENLDMMFQALRAIHFTQENTPKLKHLSIEQPCARDLEYFNTDLPDMETMSFQFVTIDNPAGFGKSLSRSPRLRFFSGYKLWGLRVSKSKTHILVLPNCTDLDLYRSDDLNYLKIWAPKLTDLNLQACYSITEVTLLDRKPKASGPEYNSAGDPSKYKVNIINTRAPKGNITTHPRCSKFQSDLSDDYDSSLDLEGNDNSWEKEVENTGENEKGENEEIQK